MSEETYGPFQHGPNWQLERQESTADELRTWCVVREDEPGSKPVGCIRELPAKPNACTRFVAETLEGRSVGPERPTGPNDSLSDLKRHLGDA